MTAVEAYLVEADQVMDSGLVLPVVDGIPVLPGWEVFDGTPYRQAIVEGKPRFYGWLVRHCRYDRPPEAIAPSVWCRELRLWACDCAARVQPANADRRSLEAIAVSRRYAVGDATTAELRAAAWSAWVAVAEWSAEWSTAAAAAARAAASTASWGATTASLAAGEASSELSGEREIQAIMLAKRLQGLL